MGDGTVAACALHTADRYRRIAEFAQSRSPMPARGGPDRGMHSGGNAAESVDLGGLLERLAASRDALSFLPELTDERLDTVPPAGSFRFCDGQRTLEQVVAALLTHQAHQIDAMKAALA